LLLEYKLDEKLDVKDFFYNFYKTQNIFA